MIVILFEDPDMVLRRWRAVLWGISLIVYGYGVRVLSRMDVCSSLSLIFGARGYGLC